MFQQESDTDIRYTRFSVMFHQTLGKALCHPLILVPRINAQLPTSEKNKKHNKSHEHTNYTNHTQ